jgi:hypothetical protein
LKIKTQNGQNQFTGRAIFIPDPGLENLLEIQELERHIKIVGNSG